MPSDAASRSTTGWLYTLAVDLRLALRNILRQRRRSLIAIAAIGFGVVSMMLAGGYVEWTFWATREEAISNRLGHVQVVKPGYHDNGQADPFTYLLPADAAALSALEHAPGVRSVAPRLSFTGLVSHGDNTISFMGEGIDPLKDASVNTIAVMQGQGLSATNPNGILMGTGLAANLGVKTGDTIVLLASTPSGGINAVEGQVRGLVSSGMKAFDDAVLRVTIDMARELLRVPGSHVWIATLERTEMTDAVTTRLQSDPTLKGYEVVPWTMLADFYNKLVELFSRQVGVVNLIISAIIVLSISNTMTMSVMERTVEIGTAMALGVRRRRILGLFLMEGALLGFLGGVIGVSVGYTAAEIISAVGIPMPPAPGMSRGFTAGINVTPGIIAEALILAVTTTLIASIYPAWRASRLVIVEALRHNR